MKTVIIGGPQSGKTTLANSYDHPTGSRTLYHTDDFIDEGWSEDSETISHLFDRPGPWIVEGVTAVRALRKWLKRNPDGKPCDEIIHLRISCESLSPAQATMAKGHDSIMREIFPQLVARGVLIR